MISLDNGNTWSAPANLDPIGLERLWDALLELMDPIAHWVAVNDSRWPSGDKVRRLELYLDAAGPGHKLTVG